MRASRRALEKMSEDALERLPADIRRLLYNVQIEVKATPGPEAGKWDKSETLLGLYTGLTREQMKTPYSGSYMPARIILYQKNLERYSKDEEELSRRVEETLRHEIAHHFGFDEAAIQSRLEKAITASRSSARSKRRPQRR